MEIKAIIFSTCEEFSALKLYCLGVDKQELLRIPEYWWEVRVGSSPQPGWTIGPWAGIISYPLSFEVYPQRPLSWPRGFPTALYQPGLYA